MFRARMIYLRDNICKYKNRNTYILDQEYRKTVANTVNLHYWSFSKSGKIQNLGDYLSKVVVDYMLKLKGIDPIKKVSKTKHLYAIGSILQNGMNDSVVWGSGYLYEQNSKLFRLGVLKYFRKLDIRAVRGPETRRELMRGGVFSSSNLWRSSDFDAFYL